MGLWGKIKSVGKGVGAVLDTVSVGFTHPIKTATAIISSKSTVKEVIKEHFEEQPVTTQMLETGLATVGYVGLLLGGATAGGAAIAKVIGKKAVSVAVKHPLGTLFGAGLLATEGGQKFVKKIPGKVFGAGEFTGEVLEKIEEDEVLPTTGEILVGAGLLGAGLIGGALTIRELEKWWEKKEGEKKEDKGIPTLNGEIPEIPEIPLGKDESPILPETVTVSPTRKRYKRRRATITPSMRQSVRVNIINSPRHTNKTFINERLLIC